MIEVYVESIRVNMTSYKRVVMLKDKAADRYLPIWIGHFEADSIAIPMQNVPVSRPLTHDLLVGALGQVGATWVRAAITRLENETFYATLVVNHAGLEVELDCRPSDAISAAIRAKVPIYVEDAVMDQAGMTFDPDARSDDRPAEADGDVVTDEPNPYWPGTEPPAGAGPELFVSLGSVTEPVLRALQSQMKAAASGRRGWIGPAQLLLGVLQQNRSAALRVLTSLSVEVDELKAILTEESAHGSRAAVLSAPAEAALRRAAEEAVRLEESAVGTEHLLLALAGEPTGPVRVALERVGVSQGAIRRQVALLLSQAPPKEMQDETSMPDEPPAEAPPGDSTT